MLRRGVVRDDVDDHPEPLRVNVGDQGPRIVQRPEQGIDCAVVGHVVPAIDHRRLIPRRCPDGIDPQLAQIGQVAANPGDVADPIAVRVGEAADVDLVNDCPPPPADRRHGDEFLLRVRDRAHAAHILHRAGLRCRDSLTWLPGWLMVQRHGRWAEVPVAAIIDRSRNGQHRFVEPEDARSGLAVSGVRPDFQMVSPIRVASASLRASLCALPGCGKPRGDPIHWPGE